MRNIDKLKLHIKETAIRIRKTRFQHKEAQRANLMRVANKLLRELHGLQYEYRHHHIAYCELRGRTREEIEGKVRDDNHPNETYINNILDAYAWTPEDIEAYTARKEKRNETA
jgi:ABC-type phosphate transport system auxiliary subunit